VQTEAAECGLACLAMVAGWHGMHVDTAGLRRRFGLSPKGATLLDLTRIADRLGLASRPLRLEPEELRLLRTPCVLHWDMSHFVVLKAVGRGGALVVHDPAVGLRRVTPAEALRHFTGVALELTPTGGFEPASAPPRVRVGALLGRLVGVRRALGQLLALAFAIEVFAMASPLFLAWVVDHAIVSADRDLLATLALGFGLLLLLQVAVTALRGWLLVRLGASMKVQARANLLSHLLRLPVSYFESRHMGDVMSSFGSQEAILQAITTELVVAVLDGLMCAVTLALMLLFAPALAAVAVAGAALYATLRWATYAPLRRASAEAIVWGARRDSHFLEMLRGIKAVRLFGAEEERRAHWLNLLVETVNRKISVQKLSLLFRTCNMLLLGGLTLLVVWIGANRVLAGAFSVRLLLAFLSYQGQFLSRVSELVNRLVDLRMLRLHAERLADIALTEPEPRDEPPPPPADAPGGRAAPPVALEVRDLRFRYAPGEPWVLDGVSFRVEAGESVAIAGPSGCGKTTLLKVLAGLLPPTEGEVLVDGVPLGRRLGLARHRAALGVVMQDDQLFAGSIADNVCFFAGRPDRGRIERCARAAAVHEDIAAMPMGHDTLIGDMGTVLSGGQKQRVLLARALYRRPGLLLLDEATSHLDVARERAVNAALAAARMTRIAIAHRPETIRAAGRVITLEAGRVVGDRAAAAAVPADGGAG
jgi:ATP-binding cassette, subfamily B, bacterial CvaB/MchF/RaxB